MKGNPSVTTFTLDGLDQIHAFVRGDDGQLHMCYWNPKPGITSWQWLDLGHPVRARVNSSPSSITSKNDTPIDFLHVFARGNDGHLYERLFDSNHREWHDWQDHGLPVWDETVTMSPGVVTDRRSFYIEDGDYNLVDTTDQVYAFVWGSGGHLHTYREPQSVWEHHGQPLTQIGVCSEPAAINHSGLVYAYVVGDDNHLWVRGSLTDRADFWMWYPLFKPHGVDVTWVLKPALVSFTHDREHRMYAFVLGSDGHLWNHFWSGWPVRGQANWGDLGAPVGAKVSSQAGAVTFRFEGTDRIYVFVRGSDNHLHVCFWDGLQWSWTDLGRPTTSGNDVMARPDGGDTPVSDAPGVVTFKYVEPSRTTDRIYAFVRGFDNHLHVCYWNGVDLWLWTDLGTLD